MIRLTSEKVVVPSAVFLLVAVVGCQRQATTPPEAPGEKQSSSASRSERKVSKAAAQLFTLEVSGMT